MTDALSVVSQLRDLASEPQNREVIVNDQGCLPGLVLFLDHRSAEVLFATLQVSTEAGLVRPTTSWIFELSLVFSRPQTLRYLAEFSPNIPNMKNELGMMVSLENLIVR